MEKNHNFFGNKKLGTNERAAEQNKDRLNGGYGGDYFDENEHRAGQEKYNLATGERYKNDGSVESAHSFVVEKSIKENQDLINELVNDPATEWLRKNNFDEFGNKIDKAA